MKRRSNDMNKEYALKFYAKAANKDEAQVENFKKVRIIIL